MVSIRVLAYLVPFLSLSQALPRRQNAWPYAPFTTEGRWIKNSLGETVTLVGVNWPGAADAAIPEGLQYSSIANILGKVKELGMNTIRLTYATQMVDEYFENGEVDVPVLTAFTNVFGAANGTALWNQVVAKNPEFNDRTTRLQVYDAIAAEAVKQEIYVHLDNHMSQAYWCCNTQDGNAWFGDRYFDVEKWKRGLSFLAARGKNWGSLVSVALRNELRSPDNNPAILPTYNWETWYKNVVPAMNGINAANPDILIYLSGLGFDTTLAPITTGANLGNGTTFSKSSFAYADKLVLELHNYATTSTNCANIRGSLYNGGYNGMNATDPAVKNVFPVLLTEFGHAQTAAAYASVYSICLKDYLGQINGGWMVWVLAGSYYIREGVVNSDETWGLLNHDWSAWRDPDGIEAVIKPMVQETLAL
ncbi:putative endoglucanase E1 [Bisporella sp. PMI_857]|nr:putative endoglucanase E1 [Bisporella sp. PMI_857]